jgi:NAD(P)-dependent dehydrogenase (short-subunit alcohol dehydrogenase family)
MRTPLTEGIFANPELVTELEGNTPVGRIGKPEDLEGLVVYLASDGSDFMTGSEILIDGGFTVW